MLVWLTHAAHTPHTLLAVACSSPTQQALFFAVKAFALIAAAAAVVMCARARRHLPALPFIVRPSCRLLLQALDKARKDVEKARKVRDPLTKKLTEDPQALQTMAAEVQQLQQQLAAL